MATYQAPRGTQDILPADQPYWRFVTETARDLAARYGYQFISTPTFESSQLFIRGVGQGTDLVEKEMYTFEDKGGDQLTLRSEGTAPVVRAYLEHGLYAWSQPVKLCYITPIFRQERPQAGRYREHHQFGVECIGEIDPAVDAEVISLALHLYRAVGIGQLAAQLNSIGDRNCRPAYLEKLKAYYSHHQETICNDCKVRLVKNPLRLLDCKNDPCQPIIAGAPKMLDYLCPECADHFARLRRILDLWQVPYTINPRLVRGLDYYTKTVFEVWVPGIGSQSAVGGGGRYDGLAEALGGPPTPGIGFGLGIERIILAVKQAGVTPPALPAPQVYIATLGPAARETGLRLLWQLREAGIATLIGYGHRSLKAQMKQANGTGVRYALILGEDEVATGRVTLRDLQASRQESVPVDQIIAGLQAKIGKGLPFDFDDFAQRSAHHQEGTTNEHE